jgi:hypothetical protein
MMRLGRTAERADNWHGLRRKLLGDNNAETGCDLRYEPHQQRAAFGNHATINNEARRFGNRFGHKPRTAK